MYGLGLGGLRTYGTAAALRTCQHARDISVDCSSRSRFSRVFATSAGLVMMQARAGPAAAVAKLVQYAGMASCTLFQWVPRRRAQTSGKVRRNLREKYQAPTQTQKTPTDLLGGETKDASMDLLDGETKDASMGAREHGLQSTQRARAFSISDVVKTLLLHSDPWHGGGFWCGALRGAGLHAGTGEGR